MDIHLQLKSLTEKYIEFETRVSTALGFAFSQTLKDKVEILWDCQSEMDSQLQEAYQTSCDNSITIETLTTKIVQLEDESKAKSKAITTLEATITALSKSFNTQASKIMELETLSAKASSMSLCLNQVDSLIPEDFPITPNLTENSVIKPDNSDIVPEVNNQPKPIIPEPYEGAVPTLNTSRPSKAQTYKIPQRKLPARKNLRYAVISHPYHILLDSDKQSSSRLL